MTTVTAVQRAAEEAMRVRLQDLGKPASGDPMDCSRDVDALRRLVNSPTALTILANRLSDRGEAGNEASRMNLVSLQGLRQDLRHTLGDVEHSTRLGNHIAALEWAIDQLTPPEFASKPAKRCTLEVGCDETGVCYADAAGQPEQCGRDK